MTPVSAAKHPAYDIGLPKWPQMLVWGNAVTPEQAQDIILRTDSFLTSVGEYHGGNNRRWNAWARETLGLAAAHTFAESLPKEQTWRALSVMQEVIDAELGCVRTEYVRNSWASCAFIYGPHGWAHPDGTIGYSDNVGKWPSVEEVCQDWDALAKAFPFLNLSVTLMSEEQASDEPSTPLVSICVMDGQAYVLDAPVLPPADPGPVRDLNQAVQSLMNPAREQGLRNDVVEAFAQRVKPAVDKAISRVVQELKAAA